MNRVVWSCVLLVFVTTACSSSGGQGAMPAIAGERQLDDGTVGVAYTVTLALLGDAPHAVTVAEGALPPGISLSTAGLLSGTPTQAGSFEFTERCGPDGHDRRSLTGRDDAAGAGCGRKQRRR
ncbi:MAG: Ig domain-containing protein [Planctomycetota bacterium]